MSDCCVNSLVNPITWKIACFGRNDVGMFSSANSTDYIPNHVVMSVFDTKSKLKTCFTMSFKSHSPITCRTMFFLVNNIEFRVTKA